MNGWMDGWMEQMELNSRLSFVPNITFSFVVLIFINQFELPNPAGEAGWGSYFYDK
jgi:hypothetical protein